MRRSNVPRTVRRTVSVLYAVAVTSIAVYSGVTLAAAAAPDNQVVVANGTAVQVCPATGCAATSCHAVTGSAPGAAVGGTTDLGTGSSAGVQGGGRHAGSGFGRRNGGDDSDGERIYICPATGCAATSCHATSG